MNKDYNPSEKQKKCINAIPYQGDGMDETLCIQTDGQVSNDDCENCPNYKSRFIEYPITVSEISYSEPISLYKPGSLVKIKPCAEEYAGKTFLGILLGELPHGPYVTYDDEKKVLNIGAKTNPAIYVFELKKIIFGYESWWQKINSVEDFSSISEEDIDNVWYVQMLRAMESKAKEK